MNYHHSLKASIRLLTIDDLEFHFYFNQEHKPAIFANNCSYHHLPELFHDFPLLMLPNNIAKAAEMINFLMTGLEFQFIENIEDFKIDYLQRLDSESSYDKPDVNIADYGAFDISGMHAPLIERNQLTFFVRKDHDHLPYKVSLAFPVASKQPHVKYELLPIMNGPTVI